MRRRGRGALIGLAVVLLLLVGLFAVVAWMPLRGARAEWREGRVAEATVHAERWLGYGVWRNQYHQFLGAAYLTVGNTTSARPHLEAVRGTRLWISALPKEEVAQRLFARGREAEYLEYDAAVKTLGESDDAALYRTAALAATGRVSEAETAFRALGGDGDAKKRAALERAIAQRKEGAYPYVVDRNGSTVATYHAANRDVVAVNSDFEALVEKDAGELTIESVAASTGTNDTIETTLDPVVQKSAVRALSGYRGALVAIDPATQEILAIASTRGKGPLANLALQQQYEPGSVIKLLTASAAMTQGVKLDFPYNCTGVLEVDGRNFGDWLQGGHGSLDSLDEAMAVSCNVVFADLGIRVGAERLRETMGRAGFDKQADLGLFKVKLGSTVGRIFNKFETGLYAIGLEHETSNALHLAMIASMMANRGVLVTPKLVRSRRSILGESIEVKVAQERERILPEAVAAEMVRLMTGVVTRDNGTGRRAPVEGVSLAMKTGTAGKREDGYHAVIVAFAPVEQPKIAYALIAEGSGPAEFAAAKIAHDFMEGIRERLK